MLPVNIPGLDKGAVLPVNIPGLDKGTVEVEVVRHDDGTYHTHSLQDQDQHELHLFYTHCFSSRKFGFYFVSFSFS